MLTMQTKGNSYQPAPPSLILWTAFTDYWTGVITLIILFLDFSLIFCLVACGRPSWLLVSFWVHVRWQV